MMDISGIATSQSTSSFFFDTSAYGSIFQKKPPTVYPLRVQNNQMDISPKTPTQLKSTALDALESCGRIDRYNILRTFGNKHTNPVFLAQVDRKKSEAEGGAALRVIKTLDLSDQSFMNEAKIFSLPSHSNIINCKEILTSVALEINYDIKIQNAIVLEYASNGDLYPYLERGALSESISRFYFGQLLNAIEFLHENGYCHLDIKPENLLLDERFNLKLCDFGYAAQFTMKSLSKLVRTTCGTSSYFPPETWKPSAKEKGYDGVKADIFQLGIMLFIMLTGQPPFTKSCVQDGWFALIARGRWDEFWDFKEKGLAGVSSIGEQFLFSKELRELLGAMLEPQPNVRVSIENIRKSKWFVETFPAEPIEVQFEMLNRKATRKL